MALRVVDAENLVVLEEAMEVEVGDDHLARPQAAAVDNALRVHVDQAGFGTGDTRPWSSRANRQGRSPLRSRIAPTWSPVRESQRSGAVPRLHAIAAVLQERRTVARIGGRHQHAHRFAHGAAIVREQFDNLVERGGVGSALVSTGCRSSDIVAARASMRARLPQMVLISPLCASVRKGCARSHEGRTFVA